MKFILLDVTKKAKFNYEIFDIFESGIVLIGNEVKSIKEKNVSLNDSFIFFKKNELFIANMNISLYKFTSSFKTDPCRIRKLLLHKKEIKNIYKKIKIKKLIIIVLKIYLKNNFIKLQICLAKRKKKYDKRELIKSREWRKNEIF